MVIRKPGKYDDGSEDVPLFRLAPRRGAGSKSRKQDLPTAAWALCPMHAHAGRATGLVHQGEHLCFVIHYHMIGKVAMPCRGAGIALCAFDDPPETMRIKLDPKRARHDNGERPARCKHS
jgi:hypothetical protein